MVMFLLSAKQRKFWKPVIQGNSGLFKRLSASLALSTNVIWVLAFRVYKKIPKCCKYPILGSKITRNDIRLYLKTYEKIARWRHHWNIWHLIVKTKISPLVVHYQGSNECQKNRQNLRNLDLEVYCANIQPELTKVWSSTKNQSFLMASVGFLKFQQYCWILAKYLNRFVCEIFL